MKNLFKLTALATSLTLIGCGGGSNDQVVQETGAEPAQRTLALSAHGRVASFTPTVSGDVVLTLAKNPTGQSIATGKVNSAGYFSTSDFDARETVIVTVKNGTHKDGTKNFGDYKTAFDPTSGKRLDGSIKIGPFTTVMAELAMLLPAESMALIESRAKFFFGVPSTSDFSVEATSNSALFSDLNLLSNAISQAGGFEKVTKDLAKYIKENPAATLSKPATLVSANSAAANTIVRRLSAADASNAATESFNPGAFAGKAIASGALSAGTGFAVNFALNYGLKQLGFDFPGSPPDLDPQILAKVNEIQAQLVQMDSKLNGMAASITDIKQAGNQALYNDRAGTVSDIETRILTLSKQLSALQNGGTSVDGKFSFAKNSTNLNTFYNSICSLDSAGNGNENALEKLYNAMVGTGGGTGSLMGYISRINTSSSRYLTSDAFDAQRPLYLYWAGLLDTLYVLLDAYYRYGYPQGDTINCAQNSSEKSSRGSKGNTDQSLKELAQTYINYSANVDKMIPRRVPTGMVLDTKQNLLFWYAFNSPNIIGASSSVSGAQQAGIRLLGCADAPSMPRGTLTWLPELVPTPRAVAASQVMRTCTSYIESEADLTQFPNRFLNLGAEVYLDSVSGLVRQTYVVPEIRSRGAVPPFDTTGSISAAAWRVPTSAEISNVFYDINGTKIDLNTEGLGVGSPAYNMLSRNYAFVVSGEDIFKRLAATTYYSPLMLFRDDPLQFGGSSVKLAMGVCKNGELYQGALNGHTSFPFGAGFDANRNLAFYECGNNSPDVTRGGDRDRTAVSKFNKQMQVAYVRNLFDVELAPSANASIPGTSTGSFYYYKP